MWEHLEENTNNIGHSFINAYVGIIRIAEDGENSVGNYPCQRKRDTGNLEIQRK